MKTHSLAYQRVGIIHGYRGSGATHWQTWMARQCHLAGAETHYPKLPGRFEKPRLPAWLEAVRRTMPVIDETTALIGHSLGCPTILQLLKDQLIERVGLVVLVALPTLSRVLSSELSFLENFYLDLDPGPAARKARSAHVFTSNNDPWVHLPSAVGLADNLIARFHLLQGAGHINVASGHHTLPEVLALLQR